MLAKILLRIAYWSYKAEGLNALFQFLPARLIAPTLIQHGASIGQGVQMHSPIRFHNVSPLEGEHYANLKVGNDCYFGREVFLDLAEEILIGDAVTISMRAMILTHTHAGSSPLAKGALPTSYEKVILRAGCYLGAGCIILPGVEVGEMAIIGAGSVVTRNVQTGEVVVGTPAKSTEPLLN